MEGESLPARTYNHIAFKIEETEYDAKLAAIGKLGLDRREGRPRIEGEGRSIYFHDYDNHLFELHTGTLEQRLAKYGGKQ
jgi:catechol 2,3-dioxygenase-like lactoylglutathione lyase family enzyme